MNTWVGIRRLVRDPEVRYTQSGKAVCRFTLAVDDGWGEKKKTYFIPVTCAGDYPGTPVPDEDIPF